MNNNISTAQAFGLLDPNSTLTATSGMPTPTTYDNGMKGYGSIGLYDQALKELTARDPANMNAYNNLFGNAVPANVARSSGGGGRGGVGIKFGGQPQTQPDILMASGSPNGRGRPGGMNRGTGVIAGKTNPVYRRNVVADRAKTNQRNYNTYGSGKKFGGNY